LPVGLGSPFPLEAVPDPYAGYSGSSEVRGLPVCGVDTVSEARLEGDCCVVLDLADEDVNTEGDGVKTVSAGERWVVFTTISGDVDTVDNDCEGESEEDVSML